ncbi:hypothetical protein C8F04DRAFT_1075551 [Mycena alexandri]|uniref:CMP/dCMP-type deaminase domain-containing protein n=1 Tax=Mycena alexandri TaxID=1745969 RepID=A0AAD6TBA8_9AGAR|nr:hypothetical protein C8F04DRAFT_1075551 [Mycena alexandri]
MNKSQFYLSQCADAASKSTMYYTLGSVIVKGGKVISKGCNHQRPNYDMPGKGRPVSMHAEMSCIYNATRGRAPAPKQQVQPCKHTAVSATTTRKPDITAEKQHRKDCAVQGGVQQGFRVASEFKCRSLRGEEAPACVLHEASLSESGGRSCL